MPMLHARLLIGAATTVMLVALAVMLVREGHDPLRTTTALVGAIACGALAYRMLQHWHNTTVLHHVLGGMLVLVIFLGALATTANATNDAPDNPVLPWVLVSRLLCIGVAVMWPHWMARTRPPYRRPFLGA